MKKHLAAVIAAAGAVALVGAGVTLASTSAPAGADPASVLYGHLLLRTELPAFASRSCPLVQTDARNWAQSYSPVEQLRRNGFTAGLTQVMHSDSLRADAVVSVARFASVRGAVSELENETAVARSDAHTRVYPVPGIPGARVFILKGLGTTWHTVAFTDGQYLHIVGVGSGSKDQAVAVATALYRRIHEQVSPLTEKRSLVPLR